MKRAILALLIFSIVVNAAFDQTYVQQMNRNGLATTEKTMDISIFAGQLSEDAFQKMEAYCKNNIEIKCSVNVNKKIINITESFSPSTYYSFSGDYGLPYTTYVMEINRIPTDRFSETLEKILVAVGEGKASKNAATAIDLRDKTKNSASVESLRAFNTKLSYVVEMPSPIESAAAGKVPGIINGSRVTFNLVDVLDESVPIVIVSREINYGYVVAILGAIVLIIMAYIFVASSRPRQLKNIKKKGTIKK